MIAEAVSLLHFYHPMFPATSSDLKIPHIFHHFLCHYGEQIMHSLSKLENHHWDLEKKLNTCFADLCPPSFLESFWFAAKICLSLFRVFSDTVRLCECSESWMNWALRESQAVIPSAWKPAMKWLEAPITRFTTLELDFSWQIMFKIRIYSILCIFMHVTDPSYPKSGLN